jgi:hypothetical protein
MSNFIVLKVYALRFGGYSAVSPLSIPFFPRDGPEGQNNPWESRSRHNRSQCSGSGGRHVSRNHFLRTLRGYLRLLPHRLGDCIERYLHCQNRVGRVLSQFGTLHAMLI